MVTRYSPFLVAIHWMVAFLVILGLVIGNVVLEHMPNDDPQKILALKGHMAAGIFVLVLMLIRIFVKLFSEKPPHANTGKLFFDKLRTVVHVLFYICVIALTVSGIGLAVTAGLFDIVFGNSGQPLPASFDAFPPLKGHQLFGSILMVLVVLHVVAVIYHQFVLKDKLISRMWFGRRS
ncbi:MAG: cytochrome b/b6 domain-containing protein [Gammaproteobacteria bacterium]|nr:cytochrome b/b6 domain-containing protein [Gammaproteobacteria bacterium]